MSILDKLKALDEERFKLLDEAKAEALEMAHKAVAALNELYHDSLIRTGAPSRTLR